MHFQQRCVLVAAVLAVITTSVLAADICNMCKCLSEGGVVKSVTCDCNSQDKVLNVTEDKLTNVHHVTDFAVSNCTSVNFQKNAFRACNDLQRVKVSRVHTATLTVGVFSALSSLQVEDVSDLRLANSGFLGAELHEIILHRTNVSVLPSMALRDVKQLKKLELHGVVIGTMKASAIKLTMAEDSQFIIESCEVLMIEKGAVDIEASDVCIRNSLFEEIRNEAVNVKASRKISVMKNVFSPNCSSSGLRVHSTRIEIDENTFNILPIGLLTRSEGVSSVISFTNNIVHNFTLMSDGVDLSTMLDLNDFKNNEVLCDCNLAKSVLAYKAFQSASASREIVQQNHCHLESHCKMSLQQLSDSQENVCEEDGSTIHDLDALCQSFPLETTTADVSTRGGRAENLPADTTLPQVDTTTHEASVHTDASHHTAGAGVRTSLSALLLAALAVAMFATTHFPTS